MARNIEESRVIEREVDAGQHGRITVRITPHGVIVAPKGSPKRVGPATWAAIADAAYKAEARIAAAARRRRGR